MKFLRELFQKNFSTLFTMFLLVAVPLLGSASLLGLLYEKQELLRHLSLGQMLLYFVVIAFTMAFALTPTTFVAIITGYYFGWSGLPGMVLAYALAAAIGYELAKRLDHGKLHSPYPITATRYRAAVARAASPVIRACAWATAGLSPLVNSFQATSGASVISAAGLAKPGGCNC